MLLVHPVFCIPGALLLVACWAPPIAALIRLEVAPHVSQLARDQVKWNIWAQTSITPWKTFLAKFSAVTVTLDVFMTIIPFICWMWSPLVALKLLFGLSICTYATCAMKDILCSPRPWAAATPSQLAVLRVLDSTSDIEYGAPSLHASLSLNTYFLLVGFAHMDGMMTDTQVREARCTYVFLHTLQK
jgi:hypothetical protein